MNVKPPVSLGPTLAWMPKRAAEVLAERLKAIPYGRRGRIAAEAGVDQTTLSRWKKKDFNTNPTLENIEGLANALGKPIAWLLSDAGTETAGRQVAEPSPTFGASPEPEEHVKIRLRCPHCDKMIEARARLEPDDNA